jgi:hypothetical protein
MEAAAALLSLIGGEVRAFGTGEEFFMPFWRPRSATNTPTTAA